MRQNHQRMFSRTLNLDLQHVDTQGSTRNRHHELVLEPPHLYRAVARGGLWRSIRRRLRGARPKQNQRAKQIFHATTTADSAPEVNNVFNAKSFL
jgi:hypothetical protein